MSDGALSFAMPDNLEPELAELRDYWQGLRRGEADMPFADDVDPARLQEIAPNHFLLSVFESPARFRFENVSPGVAAGSEAALKGEFTDEFDLQPPLEQLTEQAGATLSRRAPTYFRATGSNPSYARLLLPSWGDGHVAMLIGASTALKPSSES